MLILSVLGKANIIILVNISGIHLNGTGPLDWVRFLGHDLTTFHQPYCNTVRKGVYLLVPFVIHHIDIYFYFLFSITDLIVIWLGMCKVNS